MSLKATARLLVPVVLCALVLPVRASAQAAATTQPPPQASVYAKPQAQAAARPAARPAERVAIINMQGAMAGCNDGQRDFGALQKKFEPRRSELARLGTELQGLQKQYTSQSGTMTPAARDALARSIDTKTKTLQRMGEDTEKEQQQQANEIADRILQKLAPILKKYAEDNGYGLVIDGSVPWPQGPLVLVEPTFDITKAVVDAYNAQSSAPAPPKVAK